MPRNIERQMWRQLKGAFRVHRLTFVETEDEMSEAIRASSGHRIFLEPLGSKPVTKIPQGDIVMILGNTAMNNRKFAASGEEYAILCPSQPTHLYGINAAAIALAYRYGQ